jgi:hypothetical protein
VHAPSDAPSWLLGDGIFIFTRDGVAFVMHGCRGGTFQTQELEKLDELCGVCNAPLRSALEAVMRLLRIPTTGVALPKKAVALRKLKKVVALRKRKPRRRA